MITNTTMEDNYFDTIPHGNDLDAVSGYYFKASADEVIGFWEQLVTNDMIHSGTNFDLSNHIKSIDKTRTLCIHYDFLHRVMLRYPEDIVGSGAKQLNINQFKKYIGIN